MTKPRLYHSMKARWETARVKADKGDTAGADVINQLTATEALVEILDVLQEISENLAILAGSAPPADKAAREVKPVPGSTAKKEK